MLQQTGRGQPSTSCILLLPKHYSPSGEMQLLLELHHTGSQPSSLSLPPSLDWTSRIQMHIPLPPSIHPVSPVAPQNPPVERNLAWLGAVVRRDFGFSLFFSGVSSALASALASWGFSWTGALLLLSSFRFFLSRSEEKEKINHLRCGGYKSHENSSPTLVGSKAEELPWGFGPFDEIIPTQQHSDRKTTLIVLTGLSNGILG